MSLDSWKVYVKMSPNKNKSVPQLVEKYKQNKQTCDLDRDLMRRLIRLENPDLFLNNPSNLKKLDRYLRKAFANSKPISARAKIKKLRELMHSDNPTDETLDKAFYDLIGEKRDDDKA